MILHMLLAVALSLPAAAVGSAALEAEEETLLNDIVQHHALTDPIEVDVDVTAPVEQGRDITVRVTLDPTWEGIDDTVVTIDVPPGVVVAGPASREISFVEGLPSVTTFTVRATDAGMYLLAVSARTDDSAFGTVGGYGQGYIELAPSGTGTWHKDQLPEPTVAGSVAVYDGPVTTPPTLAATEEGETPEPYVVSPLPLDPARPDGESGDTSGDVGAQTHQFRVTGCWHYVSETGSILRQRYATVQVWDDDSTSFDDLLWQGTTGTDGCFTSAWIDRAEPCCFQGNQDVYVKFFSSSTWAYVQTSGGSTYNWATGVTTVGSETTMNVGSLYPTSNQFANRVYQYIMNGADFARNRMLISGLGIVKVHIPDSCTFYTRSDDTIHLCANNVDDKSPDDVLHEYAHYVQDKAYGDSYWPSPGGSHFLCGDNQNRGLSWTEGFANFFGPRANNEMSHLNGANGDTFYSRPYDGASFSINMEVNRCTADGDDNEMNVAQSLWDLRDAVNDGLDASSDALWRIGNTIENCNDANYLDFYGGSCSWMSNGGNRCNLLRTAFQNEIDYNNNPFQTVTSQGSFAWERSYMTLSASASDSEGGCPSLSVEFRVSTNNFCSTSDRLAGTDSTSPHALSFNTALVSDGYYYTCALANDGIEDANSWDVSSSRVGIDNTDPSVALSRSGTLGSGGWYVSAVTVTLSCSDATSGVAARQYRIDGGAWQNYGSPVTVSSQGSHTFDALCRDNAGNLKTSSTTFKIDTVAPDSSAAKSGTLGDNGWYKSAVSISLACTDPSPGSGCTPQYDLDGAGFTSGSSLVVSGDGAHTFRHRAVDVAGNVGSPTDAPFKIDSAAPSMSASRTGTLGSGGWYVSSVEVTLSCTDATSGVEEIRYSLNGGTSTAYTAPFTVSANGVHNVDATCEDNAGHTTSASLSFKIDQDAPTTTAAYSGTAGDNGWYRGSVTAALSCTDATSGCASTEYDLDGGGLTAGTGATINGDGTHTLAYRSTDAAGNVETTNSDDVRIDATAPTSGIGLSGTAGNAGWYVSDVTVTLSCSDATSGVQVQTYTLNGGAPQAYSGAFTVSDQGTTSVVATCRDNAGNTDTETASFQIDSVTPEGSVAAEGLVVGGAVDVEWEASDATSGLTGVLELQETSLLGEFATVCSMPVSGMTASGTCTRTLLPGQYCWRLTVEDVAGNRLTTLGTTCSIVV